MDVTAEQRRRMEANRAAAIARRMKALGNDQILGTSFESRNQFWQATVVLELCSPSEFSVSLEDADEDTVRRLHNWLQTALPTESRSWKDSPGCAIYKLKNYRMVTDVLKRMPGIRLQHIPTSTRKTLVPYCIPANPGGWVPFHPRHVPDAVVEELLKNVPQKLKQCLLPFQWEGLRYGLRRGGRVLIADEMGLGKTVQAIAIASCYMRNGSLLVVCPASLRYVWADELERWIPSLLPTDVHLVFGQKNDLKDFETPKVVVVSFNMLRRLRDSILGHEWETLIVDESHNIRCSRRPNESEETTAVMQVARAARRAIFLSGTPSLSRPFDIFNQIDSLWSGILGNSKYEFARSYCNLTTDKDYSKGVRLRELNILLREAVMIRRLKDQILTQLPPKRRQVIRLKISPSDIFDARASCEDGVSVIDCDPSDNENEASRNETAAASLTLQELGIAKLRGVIEWLSNSPLFASEDETQKLILFGHHHKVLNAIQAYVVGKCIEYVRIDGQTEAKDRQEAIRIFRQNPTVKVAIVGITAGGVGLDLSSAQNVVFVELPKTSSELLQAEDRAHRRGQKGAVNIYIFCGKDTPDESHWQALSMSLERVSTMTNGVEDAIPGLKVQTVIDESGSIVLDKAQNADLHNVAEPEVQQMQYNNSLELETHLDSHLLMFEVSSNTGRIHLYKRKIGEILSITSLEANFKAEDLEDSQITDENVLPACLVRSGSHRNSALLFIKEWKALRPVHQKKLYGRPIQLPLERELSRLKEDAHVEGGLLKGGSRRRVMPRQEELTSPLPEGATWRQVSLLSSSCEAWQPWTEDGHPLCRFCHRRCMTVASKEPKLFSDLFCKTSCFEVYRLKTSQQYVRKELFHLERGICVLCNLDCHALVECIRNLDMCERSAYILRKAPSFQKHGTLLDRLVREPIEGNAWHADHIIPVFEGGGECNLENMRTLCVVCHVKVTADQCRRRHSLNRKAQRTLYFGVEKMLNKRLKREEDASDSSDIEDDDTELLSIKVAGSVYSGKQA